MGISFFLVVFSVRIAYVFMVRAGKQNSIALHKIDVQQHVIRGTDMKLEK